MLIREVLARKDTTAREALISALDRGDGETRLRVARLSDAEISTLRGWLLAALREDDRGSKAGYHRDDPEQYERRQEAQAQRRHRLHADAPG